MNKTISRIRVPALAGAAAAISMMAAMDASATLVNTGAHIYTANVNGVGAAARAAIDGTADVGLGAGGKGIQYHHWLDGWAAGDTLEVTGDHTAMYDPMRPTNGDASFYGYGFQAICQSGVCAGDDGPGSSGWNHTSQHILFTLVGGNQDLTITLSGDSALAPAVTGKHGPNVNLGNLGTNQAPAWVLYSGRSTTGINDLNHTFDWGPGSSHWSDIAWMEADLNEANDKTITYTFNDLSAGDYTFYIGGNATSPALPGGGAKNFYFAASSVASVPVPAALWLFGTALAGMGVIGRRRGQAT